MKKAADFMSEANAIVPKITPAEGIARHAAGATFVDVRDSGDVAKSGTIAGALRISRGMLEFRACDEHALHDAGMQKDAEIILICAAGGQAALAGKTLHEMGFANVSNVGGFTAWQEAGGPVED